MQCFVCETEHPPNGTHNSVLVPNRRILYQRTECEHEKRDLMRGTFNRSEKAGTTLE